MKNGVYQFINQSEGYFAKSTLTFCQFLRMYEVYQNHIYFFYCNQSSILQINSINFRKDYVPILDCESFVDLIWQITTLEKHQGKVVERLHNLEDMHHY